jgi:hypothetical protein
LPAAVGVQGGALLPLVLAKAFVAPRLGGDQRIEVAGGGAQRQQPLALAGAAQLEQRLVRRAVARGRRARGRLKISLEVLFHICYSVKKYFQTGEALSTRPPLAGRP